MRYIGLDLGTKTLGVSISDETKTIASGVTTIRFDEGDFEKAIVLLKDVVNIDDIEKIILGLPKNMNNTIGESAERALAFKDMLVDRYKKEVVMQDERLSTVSAHNYMIEANLRRKKRKKVVDKMAANIILQTYLDIEKGRK